MSFLRRSEREWANNSVVEPALSDGAAQVLAGTLRGAGDNRFIAQYSLFVSAILRSGIAYVLAFPLGMGLYGIWGALLIDEVLKMLLTQYRIGKGIWLTKEL